MPRSRTTSRCATAWGSRSRTLDWVSSSSLAPPVVGRIPVNVATPWVSGGRSGAVVGTRTAAAAAAAASPGWWGNGQAGALCPVDRAGYEQCRGMPDCRDQPADRDTMAVRAHDPRHCGSAGALSAGERTQAIDTEAFEVLVRSGADDVGGPASGGQDVAGDRGPIGRSTSMISRELRRNADPTAGRYLPATADRLAAARVARPRPRRVARDAQLHAVVVELLGKRWSPEQVAHDLRQRFPDHRARQLCTESIYQAIYDVTVEVTRPAKRRRRHRRRRIQGLERRGRLTGMTMIADRPADV